MSQKKKSEERPRLEAVVTDVQKAAGKESIMCLGDRPERDAVAVIPSGSRAVDLALGIGGYPRGRVVEVYGPESSGKTTLTLHAIAQVHRAGGVAAFIDAEHAFDVSYAKAIGVDPNKLLISQPDCGEQALEVVDLLVRSAEVDLVVVDSVAALVPRSELEGDMGAPQMGLHARLMSQALRKITPTMSRTGTTVMFINQLRHKIGVVFGSPETTTGGNALKFYASVRVDIRRIGKVLVGETTIGNRTRAKIVKNKCAQPFTEAEFDIRWGIGIDPMGDLLDTAERCGVTTKHGSHYAFAGKTFAQGRERARDALTASVDLRSAVESEVIAALPCYADAETKRAA